MCIKLYEVKLMTFRTLFIFILSVTAEDCRRIWAKSTPDQGWIGSSAGCYLSIRGRLNFWVRGREWEAGRLVRGWWDKGGDCRGRGEKKKKLFRALFHSLHGFTDCHQSLSIHCKLLPWFLGLHRKMSWWKAGNQMYNFIPESVFTLHGNEVGCGYFGEGAKYVALKMWTGVYFFSRPIFVFFILFLSSFFLSSVPSFLLSVFFISVYFFLSINNSETLKKIFLSTFFTCIYMVILTFKKKKTDK